MLTADELRGLWRDVERGKKRGECADCTLDTYGCARLAGVLSDALWLYIEAAREGARLDCLTTAVRALAGALRDRMA